MKICISGSQNTGKSTLISDLIKQYPSFVSPKSTYRDVITSNDLPINKECNVTGQSLIFNKLVEELITIKPEDDVILDRCVFDSYVYSLWGYLNNPDTDIDQTFMNLQLDMCGFYSDYYDLIIFIPMMLDGTDPLMERDGLRNTDESYRIEINQLFEELYDNMISLNPILAKKIVKISGSRESRVEQFNEIIKGINHV